MKKVAIAISIVGGLLVGCSSTRIHETTRTEGAMGSSPTYRSMGSPGYDYDYSTIYGTSPNMPEPSPAAPPSNADSPRGTY